MQLAVTALLQGNAFFATGGYAAARNSYSRGVDGLGGVGSGGGGAEAEDDRAKLLGLLLGNRSAAHLMGGGFGQALDDAREAVRLDPGRCKAHGRVGAALHALGRVQEALEAYDRGLLLHPEHRGLREGRDAARRALAESSGGDVAGTSSSVAPICNAAGDSLGASTSIPSSSTSSSSSPLLSSSSKGSAAGHPGKRKRSASQGVESSDATKDSAAAAPAPSATIASNYDADINAFVADISDIGTTVKKKARAVDDSCLGSPAQEVQRIMCKNHFWVNLNPFEVLQLPPLDATSEDIKQRYRALCGLVHPDKCTIEGAQRAFEYVNAAYRALTDESRRKVILGLVEAAFSKADAELKKEKSSISSSCSSSLLTEKRRKFMMITFAESEEARRRAEKNQQAYRKREGDQKAEQKKELKDAYAAEKAWQSGVNDRVSNWQDFAGLKKGQNKKRKKTIGAGK